MNFNEIKISYCSTCFNQFDQLNKTLLYNCSIIEEFSSVEIVLVNFINGAEGNEIEEWVKSNFKKFINSGSLKYLTEYNLLHWHSSIAKNIAHNQGTGKLLFNLDCDNYIQKKETQYLLSFPISDNFIYHGFNFDGKRDDGTYGRVCLSSTLFRTLGGYNEKFLPGGYQDTDLLIRAQKYTGSIIHKSRFEPVTIKNSKGEHMKHVNKKFRIFKSDEYNWKVCDTLNRLISKYNLAIKKYCQESSYI